MANKAYVYAIYPNKEQAELCQKTFGCCRFVYNQMLSVIEGKYFDTMEHSLLEQMSKSLIMAKYGLTLDYFIR